jgi:hypothetical protein
MGRKTRPTKSNGIEKEKITISILTISSRKITSIKSHAKSY